MRLLCVYIGGRRGEIFGLIIFFLVFVRHLTFCRVFLDSKKIKWKITNSNIECFLIIDIIFSVIFYHDIIINLTSTVFNNKLKKKLYNYFTKFLIQPRARDNTLLYPLQNFYVSNMYVARVKLHLHFGGGKSSGQALSLYLYTHCTSAEVVHCHVRAAACATSHDVITGWRRHVFSFLSLSPFRLKAGRLPSSSQYIYRNFELFWVKAICMILYIY